MAEGAVIIIVRDFRPSPNHCRVGENQLQRHQRDTADPKSKPSAEYRHECSVPSAPSPRNGAGQGLAPAIRTTPNASSLTTSRSIDFALLMTRDESGLAAVAALRPAIRRKNGAGAVQELPPHCLFAASVKMESRRPGTRSRSQLRTHQLAPPVRRQASNDPSKLGPHPQSTPQLTQTSGTAAPQPNPPDSTARPPL